MLYKKRIHGLMVLALLVSSLAMKTGLPTQAMVDGNTNVVPLRAIYHEPANDWETEANPIGNGYMGGMVYGGVDRDRILINEKTLWSGGPGADSGYDGGYNSSSSQTMKQNLKEVRNQLQQAMTDFAANKSAYINPSTGQLVTHNYASMSNQLKQLLISLQGTKKDFGAFQELGTVVIEDIATGNQEPVAITSNSLHVKAHESPEQLFDGNVQTKWYALAGKPSGTSHPFPIWVTAEYENPLTMDTYTLTSGNDVPNRDPKDWILYGSDDGVTYTVVDSRDNESFSQRRQTKTYHLDQAVTYRYYKLSITANLGGSDTYGCQLSEIEYGETNDDSYSQYERILDLDKGMVTVTYNKHNTHYTREYLASYPDHIMVVHLTSDNGSLMSKEIDIESPQPHKTITASDGVITMTGYPEGHDQPDRLQYAKQIRVKTDGGTVTASGGSLTIENAKAITLYIAAATNYQQSMDNSYDFFSDDIPLDLVEQRIEAAYNKPYETLKEDHISDYQSLYNRVSFDLGVTQVPSKTTDALLAGYDGRGSSPNTDQEDRYLEMLYYQFGRYLLIASSRPGTLPANLQGIWAKGLTPPWNADYHTNINVQMNYWLAEQTNLTECHRPLIDYINSLVPRGKETVQHYFYTNQSDTDSARGWTTFHENNIWSSTVPDDHFTAFWFPAAGAWLCQHIWEVYAYNQDIGFLQDNFDTMLQAALFWVDTLVTDERDGTLVVSPSFSPEHGPFSIGCTSDQAMVWDLLNNTIKASEVLGIDTPEMAEVKSTFENLSGPRIGLGGQFQEWKDEVTMDVTGDNGHRHVNHLFGLHPGNQVVAGRSDTDDQYVEAMKVTLNTRGDGGTGWSKAWKINFWARLRDGDHAYILFKNLLKASTVENLFDMHPPFQIDGNFGATAGITEMLLQSQGDAIELLPALPHTWEDGSISGLKARGNVEINMAWENHTLHEAVLRPQKSSMLTLRGNQIGNGTLTNSHGETISFVKVDDHTLSFNAMSGGVYTISNIPEVQMLRYEAEHYDAMEGVQAEACSEGGQNIGYINNGDYIAFYDVNLDNVHGIEARVSSNNNSGGQIEIHIDSLDGPIIGSCNVDYTGGWQTWVTKELDIVDTNGDHALYFKFIGGNGGLLNINYFDLLIYD